MVRKLWCFLIMYSSLNSSQMAYVLKCWELALRGGFKTSGKIIFPPMLIYLPMEFWPWTTWGISRSSLLAEGYTPDDDCLLAYVHLTHADECTRLLRDCFRKNIFPCCCGYIVYRRTKFYFRYHNRSEIVIAIDYGYCLLKKYFPLPLGIYSVLED